MGWLSTRNNYRAVRGNKWLADGAPYRAPPPDHEPRPAGHLRRVLAPIAVMLSGVAILRRHPTLNTEGRDRTASLRLPTPRTERRSYVLSRVDAGCWHTSVGPLGGGHALIRPRRSGLSDGVCKRA